VAGKIGESEKDELLSMVVEESVEWLNGLRAVLRVTRQCHRIAIASDPSLPLSLSELHFTSLHPPSSLSPTRDPPPTE
jgi:hypothetical protein